MKNVFLSSLRPCENLCIQLSVLLLAVWSIAFYHHALSMLMVKKMKSVGAQVLLTTHNTNVITNELLRPDCYFIMDHKGIEAIFEKTDKELREAHNIEKMYKAGAFND